MLSLGDVKLSDSGKTKVKYQENMGEFDFPSNNSLSRMVFAVNLHR